MPKAAFLNDDAISLINTISIFREIATAFVPNARSRRLRNDGP